MGNFDYVLYAIIFGAIGAIVIPLMSNFNLWKVFIYSMIVSTLTSVFIFLISFYHKRKGVNGEWGSDGVIAEILNPRAWEGGLYMGILITITLILAIYLSRK